MAGDRVEMQRSLVTPRRTFIAPATSMPENPKTIPISVFTGFLGAGKTTIILSLLPQFSPDYKVVLLKNEFGDIEVDSQLAKQSSLAAVSEILNGCMCCVLVGQMKTALLEIAENYSPDRVLIESSGSAFPATLAFQIRELERETNGMFYLDAIITVIDAENFIGYEDKSLTARMQAQYTDLLLINKWENVSERDLDVVIDRLNDLNEDTPRIRCTGRNGVPPSLLFGIDSRLTSQVITPSIDQEHNSEVETASVYRNFPLECEESNHDACHHTHYPPDSYIQSVDHLPNLDRNTLIRALGDLHKEVVWRVKGFVQFEGEQQVHILNWAFGRYTLSLNDNGISPFSSLVHTGSLACTVMGARGEIKSQVLKFAKAVGSSTLL